MKNLLFPRVFQLIGWILFIPAVIVGVMLFCELNDCNTGVDFPTGVMEVIINDAVIIGTALGGVFIVCSKERHEDEMTRSIRLASLLNSLYVYVALLVVSTLAVNGIDFLKVMILNLVMLPVIYVFIFRMEMRRFYKMSEEDEE